MEAFDGVIVAAAFDGGPFDDVAGGIAHGVAEISLLEDFFGAGASLAVGEELIGADGGVLDAVDDVEEAEFEGVGEGDAVVEVPGRETGAGLLGEWLKRVSSPS